MQSHMVEISVLCCSRQTVTQFAEVRIGKNFTNHRAHPSKNLAVSNKFMEGTKMMQLSNKTIA